MRKSQLFDNLSMKCFGWVHLMARFDRKTDKSHLHAFHRRRRQYSGDTYEFRQ